MPSSKMGKVGNFHEIKYSYRRCLYSPQDNREMGENPIRSRRCMSGALSQTVSDRSHWETGKVRESDEA